MHFGTAARTPSAPTSEPIAEYGLREASRAAAWHRLVEGGHRGCAPDGKASGTSAKDGPLARRMAGGRTADGAGQLISSREMTWLLLMAMKRLGSTWPVSSSRSVRAKKSPLRFRASRVR